MWSGWDQGNSNGSLVLMVRLVPTENDVIPIDLSVNMHLIKGTYFVMWSGWVQGNSDCPLVPMVRLVTIEKHIIPMVLLVNMHPIKGT